MTKETTYLKIRLSQIPRSIEDELSSDLFFAGAAGLAEVLEFEQPNLVYEAIVQVTDLFELDAFFEQSPGENFQAKLLSKYPDIKINYINEPHRDWLEEWRKTFKSFQLVGPFWVVPSWEPVRGDILMPLRIEPGMAFGVGTHETTRLAATHLNDMKSLVVGKSVLDVGTGTGILALVTEKLGAKEAVAIDNDPEATRTAKENMQHNQAQVVEVWDRSLAEIAAEHAGHFDIVIANIIDGVLIHLREDLCRCLKPGGTMVLSGILLEREALFVQEFIHGMKMQIVRRSELNEWVAFDAKFISKSTKGRS
jgi:ribosomal protein L11 methyltransferase